jgi:hypothetical protein
MIQAQDVTTIAAAAEQTMAQTMAQAMGHAPAQPVRRPRLLVPKDMVAQQVKLQISRGARVRRQRIQHMAELEVVRGQKNEWVESYMTMLGELFDDSSVADECNDWVGVILPEYAELGAFAEQVYLEIDHRLKRLRALLKWLEQAPAVAVARPEMAGGADYYAPPAPAAASQAVAAPATPPAAPPAALVATVVAPAAAPAAAAVVVAAPAAAPAAATPVGVPLALAAERTTERVVDRVAERSEVMSILTAPAQAANKSAEARPAEPAGGGGSPSGGGVLGVYVHGDESAKQDVVKFMEDMGVRLVDLPKHPGGDGANGASGPDPLAGASFAVIVPSAEDAAVLRAGAADPVPGRCRAVLFQLGYLAGRLGPRRVFVLHAPSAGDQDKAQDKVRSDEHGVTYVPLDAGGGWQLHLARQLKRAGVPVDLNRMC